MRGLAPDREPGPGSVVRLDHPRELLALVPYQLRFHPAQSVVLVGLDGPRRRVGLVARLDLRDVLGVAGPGLVARTVARLADDGVDEVVAVVYADEADPREPDRGLRPAPEAPCVRACEVVRTVCRFVGPVSTWLVTRGRYVGLDCRDGGCCPPGGRPVDDLDAGGFVRGLPDRDVHASREHVGAIPSASAAARRSASGARSRWSDARLRARQPLDVLGWRQRSLDTWRAALAATEDDPVGALPPAVLGRLEAALIDRAVRDAVLLTLVDPAGVLPDAVVRHEDARLWDPERAGVEDAGDAVAEEEGGAPDDVGRRGAECPRAADRACTANHPCDLHDAADACESARVRVPTWHGDGPRAEGSGVDSAFADALAPAAVDEMVARALQGDEDTDPDEVDDTEAAGSSDGRSPGAWASCRVPDDVREGIRSALDGLVDPRCAREPDDRVVAAGRRVLELVVAHGRRERQAPALALLGLLAWWEGDAVRACVLVDRALCQDPGHRLAEVVDRALGAGLPPAWMRRRC